MKQTIIILSFILLAGCVTTGGPDKSKMSEGYYNQGLANLQRNELELALADFHRAIQTDSKNKLAYYGLGLIRERQEKFDEAEEYFDDAVDIDSNFSEAYNMLGVVYSRQKKWKEALKAYNKALENKLYTTPHITYLNIGNMYMVQRDYPKAIEAYRESKSLVNQDITVYRLGMAYLEAGRIREAIAEFQEGARMAPNNAEMRFALALAYLKDGNKRSALTEFRTVEELAPKSDTARTARDYITTLEKSKGK
jgi:type IV pilus assembly protein PilF